MRWSSRPTRWSATWLSATLLATALGVVPAQAATGVVNCSANPGALQPAINAATGGATVRVSGTCRGNFTIDKDLTLEGSGRAPSLDGGGSGLVLGLNFDPILGPLTSPAPTIHIVGLTVRGGGDGGIVSWAESHLQNVTVRDNAGHGIFLHTNTVTLRRSVVSGNSGDGIGSMGSVTIVDSAVRNNGGHGLSGGNGFDVVRSTIEANGGRGIAGGTQTGIGVDSSTIRGNRDGGIDVPANSALVMSNSLITRNTASTEGGGIRASSSILAAFQVTGSTISGNTAVGDGGGIYVSGAQDEFGDVIDATTIRGNIAGGNGGGIFNGSEGTEEGFALRVRNTAVTQNTAGVRGGGIYNDDVVILDGARVVRNAPDNCVGC